MVRSNTIKNKVYKYVQNKNVFIKTNLYQRSFSSEWLNVDVDGTITVKGNDYNGYAWDGCSPKINFLDFIIGTPDGKFDYRTEKPLTYYASMIHDAIYQYKNAVPISRLEADIIFIKMLRNAGFMWWLLYGTGVILGGAFYGKWRTKKNVSALKISIESESWLLVDYQAMAKEHLSALVRDQVLLHKELSTKAKKKLSYTKSNPTSPVQFDEENNVAPENDLISEGNARFQARPGKKPMNSFALGSVVIASACGAATMVATFFGSLKLPYGGDGQILAISALEVSLVLPAALAGAFLGYYSLRKKR